MGLFKSLKGSGPVRSNNSDPSESLSHPRLISDIENPYQPPPYAPPTYTPPTDAPPTNPPPYHDWQSFTPDVSNLPPPPSFSATQPNLTSAHNATYSAAAAGHAFCASNPPFTPSLPAPKVYQAAQAGRIGLVAAHEFQGNVELKATGGGKYGEIWHVESTRGCPDANLISELPMYFAMKDNPLGTGTSRTIYYEVRVLGMRGEDAAVAIGFVGKPYPGWRLPGWQRGSIGVHGDDGRRFVNDSWGMSSSSFSNFSLCLPSFCLCGVAMTTSPLLRRLLNAHWILPCHKQWI